MTKLLRAAVIGAGSMGRNHCRVYSEMEDVELVAVSDPDRDSLSRVSQRYHVRTYTDVRSMLEREQLDMVSVVVPTELHAPVASLTLSAGVPTLVEKPIAATVEEGAALVALAKQHNTLLTIGHIERFNPAIIALKQELNRGTLGRVYQIHVRRIGPFPARIKDVGVVVDLATHDLDIMHYLTDSNVVKLHAETGRRLHTSHEDLLTALLRYDNDVIGMLDINWLAPTKVRELSVIGERGMFVANYLTQDLVLYENDSATQGDWHLSVLGVSEGRMIRYKVYKKEPLREELEAFGRAVRSSGPAPVSGEDALLALAVAQKLIESGACGAPVQLDEAHGFTISPASLHIPTKTTAS
ncbi:MAG: Gfo/Idh/MocA family oxidoreductase [Roseiflexaceae bacterium]